MDLLDAKQCRRESPRPATRCSEAANKCAPLNARYQWKKIYNIEKILKTREQEYRQVPRGTQCALGLLGLVLTDTDGLSTRCKSSPAGGTSNWDSRSKAKFPINFYKSVGLKVTTWATGLLNLCSSLGFVLIWSWPSCGSFKIRYWSPLNPPSITAHPRHLFASGRSFHMPWNQQRKTEKVVPASGPQWAKLSKRRAFRTVLWNMHELFHAFHHQKLCGQLSCCVEVITTMSMVEMAYSHVNLCLCMCSLLPISLADSSKM